MQVGPLSADRVLAEQVLAETLLVGLLLEVPLLGLLLAGPLLELLLSGTLECTCTADHKLCDEDADHRSISLSMRSVFLFLLLMCGHEWLTLPGMQFGAIFVDHSYERWKQPCPS